MPLTPLLAPQDPSLALRHRVSVFNLTADELAALRGAIAKMQELRDNRGFEYFAGIHGWPQFRCQHSTAQGQALLFLPWHRAYLYLFELAMQEQNPAARLCWWAWPGSRGVGIPPAYAEQEVDAHPNPLASGPLPENVPNPPVDWDPTHPITQREPGDPAELPDANAVEKVLAISDYYQFELAVEQQLHNSVHGWVGGDMGVVATSAYDPIFWAHHTMVDRVWSLWQSRHASPGPPPDTYSRPLGFGKLTVGDVLDSKRLGYDYAASVQHVQVP
jgi:tyrosinase